MYTHLIKKNLISDELSRFKKVVSDFEESSEKILESSYGKIALTEKSLSAYGELTMRKTSLYSKTTAATLMKKKDIKPLKSSSRKTIFNSKVNHYNFGLTKLIVTTTCLLGLAMLYSTVRFFVINNQTSSSRFLTDVSRNACKMYVATLMYDITLFELVMWNNDVLIGFKSTLDYYNEAKTRLQGLYNNYLSLLTKDEGEASQLLKEKLNLPMCEVYRNTEEGKKDYGNCTIAMGGININPVWRWWPMYLVLGDSLVRDWRNTNTQEERNSLLKLDQYSSMFVYSSYNLWGTADANYYNVMFPAITLLIQELDKIMPIVNLTNIISAIFFVLLIPLAFRFIGQTLHEILVDFWKMIYSVPLNLIDTNARLKQKLKLAYTSNSFTKFG